MSSRTGLDNYSKMVWATKGGLTQIKNMDTVHIRNTLKTIKNGKGGNFCGYSSQDWGLAFKLELGRRDKMADAILSTYFPKFHAVSQRILTTPQFKTNTFTTKGITRY